MVKVQNEFLENCESLVRKADRDRYYLYAASRSDTAQDLLPLFAFNCEIAKTRDIVTEPTLGLIRLQWWRDALEEIYEGKPAPRHEVLTPLETAIEKHELPQAPFMTLLEARERDLEPKPFVTVLDLKTYAETTSAPLNELALSVLGQEENDDTMRAVSAGFALTGMIRSLPYRLHETPSPVPLELVKAYDLESLPQEKDALLKAVPPVVKDLCRTAESCLESSPRSSYMKAVRELAQIYLKRIRKYGYNPCDERIHNRPLGFLLKTFLKL